MATKIYDLIFITTFIKPGAIDRLLESLQYNTTLDLCVVIVAQNGLSIDPTAYNNSFTTVYTTSISDIVNSSRGRNIGIDYALKTGLRSKFVMFPVDDSSFDSIFFNNLLKIDPAYCYVTDVRTSDKTGYVLKLTALDGQHIHASAWNKIGATNIIINFTTFLSTGYFDECMGVGALYGAGEDGDYFLRSLQFTNYYIYTKRIWSYHPSGSHRYKTMRLLEITNRFRNYGRGVVYMLCKHKMYSQAFKISFKALAGSLVMLFRLNLKMSFVYLTAFYVRLCFLLNILLHRSKLL